MVLDEKQKARLLLAERLLELAEHSSEVEMRSSLSRIYYAVYHVATVLVGNMSHGEIPSALEGKEKGLGERYKRLFELRNRADYNPIFVEQEFGDLANFKIQFPQEIENARSLYERLLQIGAV
jgi:uncharacterized protein (UPF0332 family)